MRIYVPGEGFKDVKDTTGYTQVTSSEQNPYTDLTQYQKDEITRKNKEDADKLAADKLAKDREEAIWLQVKNREIPLDPAFIQDKTILGNLQGRAALEKFTPISKEEWNRLDFDRSMATEAAKARAALQPIVDGTVTGDEARILRNKVASSYNKMAFQIAGKNFTGKEKETLTGLLIMQEGEWHPGILDKWNPKGYRDKPPTGNVVESLDSMISKLDLISGGSAYEMGQASSGGDGRQPEKSWEDFTSRAAPQDLNAILNMPANLWEELKSPLAPITLPYNMIKGQLENWNEDLGRPMEGGDILGRMGENIYNRPFSTLLDFLVLKGGLKGVKGKIKPGSLPPEAEVPKIPLKEQLSNKMAGSLVEVKPQDIVGNQNLNTKAVQMTGSRTISGMAEEMNRKIPVLETKVSDWAKKMTSETGDIPLEEKNIPGQPKISLLDRALDEARNTPEARQNERVMAKVEQRVRNLLSTGEQIRNSQGELSEATNYNQINEARKSINRSNSQWYNKQATDTPANIEHFLTSKVSFGLKNILAEADTENVVSGALDQVHTAMEAYPAYSEVAQHPLATGGKYNIIGKAINWGLSTPKIMATRALAGKYQAPEPLMKYLTEPELVSAASPALKTPIKEVLSNEPITAVGNLNPKNRLYFNPNSGLPGQIERVKAPVESTWQKPALEKIMNPLSKTKPISKGRAAYIEPVLDDIVSRARASPEQAVMDLAKFVTNFGEGATRENWLDLRAGINKYIDEKLVVNTGKNRRANYGTRVLMAEHPDVGPVIRLLEGYIKAIDNKFPRK